MTVLEDEKNIQDFRGEVKKKKGDLFECVNVHG